jgi:hypothetical protein
VTSEFRFSLPLKDVGPTSQLLKKTQPALFTRVSQTAPPARAYKHARFDSWERLWECSVRWCLHASSSIEEQRSETPWVAGETPASKPTSTINSNIPLFPRGSLSGESASPTNWIRWVRVPCPGLQSLWSLGSDGGIGRRAVLRRRCPRGVRVRPPL